MKNTTKNQSTVSTVSIDIKQAFKEKLAIVKDKLSKKDLLHVNELSMDDKYEQGIDFLISIESGKKASTDYSFQESEDSFIITIPKSNLNFNDSFRIPEKGKLKIPYRVIFTIGQYASDRVKEKIGLKLTFFEYEK